MMKFPKSSTSPVATLQADEVAVIVRRRLERPMLSAAGWGLFTSVVLGTASFGLLPLLIWPGRFRDYVAEEARVLQEVAEWARVRSRRPAAVGPVLAAAEDLSFRPVPWIACLLLVLFVVASFAIQFTAMPLTWEALLSCTYYYNVGNTAQPIFSVQQLHHIWGASLGVGYALHWLQVRAHQSDVRRFVTRLNPIIAAEGLPQLSLPRRGFGLGPMCIVGAVLMSLYGVWWGVPMVLAGAAQRRYMRGTSPALRRDLIDRLRDIAEGRRLSGATAHHCSNPRCLASLREQSRFCTRCGSPAEARV